MPGVATTSADPKKEKTAVSLSKLEQNFNDSVYLPAVDGSRNLTNFRQVF